MLEIIAHRGSWSDKNECNTEKAFRKALTKGFGIETDLRDFLGEVVISHDIPTKGCMSLSQFLNIVSEYPPTTLALNIKSDGLVDKIKSEKFPHSRYFFFDMSVPDAIQYNKKQQAFYTRISDVEPSPSLFEQSEGVWLDCFFDNKLNTEILSDVLDADKSVALVSPELHGYRYDEYWATLLLFCKSQREGNIALCTDKPDQAKEYFK